jgi:hypothetical protein
MFYSNKKALENQKRAVVAGCVLRILRHFCACNNRGPAYRALPDQPSPFTGTTSGKEDNI